MKNFLIGLSLLLALLLIVLSFLFLNYKTDQLREDYKTQRSLTASVVLENLMLRLQAKKEELTSSLVSDTMSKVDVLYTRKETE